jgi:hypothetical protein
MNKTVEGFIKQLISLGATEGIAFMGTKLFTEATGKIPVMDIEEIELELPYQEKIFKIKFVTGIGYALPNDQGVLMEKAYYEMMVKAAEPLVLENRRN